MSETVLAIVAHADDETLGCGGTLAAHAARGDAVHCLIVADGVSSRQGEARTDVLERDDACARAMQILGVNPPVRLAFPDQRLDATPFLDIIQAIEAHIATCAPTLVYTHHADDLNNDHRVVAQAVLTALRPMPAQSVRSIYAFETLSATEWNFAAPAFRPSRFVDISETLEVKMAAIECYAAEMRDFPHTRSREGVRALATLRGVNVGVAAAEAFVTLRQIDRL
ncbi:MAG: PIG-L family deacetylase [Brevundimonas sp.]|nr:MAG: PIG-L family deacetylase [Brevundimonas sp.]